MSPQPRLETTAGTRVEEQFDVPMNDTKAVPRVQDYPLPVPVRGPGSASTEQSKSMFSLSNVWGALRRKWFIMFLFGSVAAAGAGYAAWMLIPAPYTAHSDVRIRTFAARLPGRATIRGIDYAKLKNLHMSMVKSDTIRKAILRDPKVASTATIKNHDDPKGYLQKMVNVKDTGSEFFRISIKGEDADELTTIMRALIDAYRKVVLDNEEAAADERLKHYSNLLEDKKSLMQIHKDWIKNVPGTGNPNQPDQTRQFLLDRIANLSDELGKLDRQIQMKESVRDVQNKKIAEFASQPIHSSVIERYILMMPEYIKLQNELSEHQKTLIHQKRILRPGNPSMVKTEGYVKQSVEALAAFRKKQEPLIRKQMIEEFKAHRKSSNTKIQTEIDTQKSIKMKILKERESIYGKLDKHGVNRQIVESKAKEIEQLRLFMSGLDIEIVRRKEERKLQKKQPRVTISPKPEVTKLPDRKKQYMGTAVAGFGAFGLVLLGIVFLDVRARRINSLQQLADGIGLVVLGSLPSMPTKSTARRKGKWSDKARYWHGVLTEAIDSARTILLREADRNSMRVFMVASANACEGKTTVSCHLATSLARSGRKVLLIDGDMRRPFVHSTFNVPQEPGLAELLRGATDQTDEAIRPTEIKGLSVLPAGQADAKTLEMLAQDRFAELLDTLKTQFDLIVLDSAPVLSVTDSLLMAQNVDGVLFSVRRDVSRSARVMAACQRLSLLGVPLLGAVAIGLDDVSDSYRYPYNYGYGTNNVHSNRSNS